MQQGIESIPSPKQLRRPLPSLLYVSFFYVMNSKIGLHFVYLTKTLLCLGASWRSWTCRWRLWMASRPPRTSWRKFPKKTHVVFIYYEVEKTPWKTRRIFINIEEKLVLKKSALSEKIPISSFKNDKILLKRQFLENSAYAKLVL